MPRLRDRGALEAGLTGLQLLWEQDGFALADGHDTDAGRYRGLVLPSDPVTVTITDATVIVPPDRALAQRAADQAARPGPGDAAGAEGGSGSGPLPGRDGGGGPGPQPPPPGRRPRPASMAPRSCRATATPRTSRTSPTRSSHRSLPPPARGCASPSRSRRSPRTASTRARSARSPRTRPRSSSTRAASRKPERVALAVRRLVEPRDRLRGKALTRARSAGRAHSPFATVSSARFPSPANHRRSGFCQCE